VLGHRFRGGYTLRQITLKSLTLDVNPDGEDVARFNMASGRQEEEVGSWALHTARRGAQGGFVAGGLGGRGEGGLPWRSGLQAVRAAVRSSRSTGPPTNPCAGRRCCAMQGDEIAAMVSTLTTQAAAAGPPSYVKGDKAGRLQPPAQACRRRLPPCLLLPAAPAAAAGCPCLLLSHFCCLGR